MAVSQDGQFLYQLANGAGAIDEFHVNDDGSLSSLGTVDGLGIAAAAATRASPPADTRQLAATGQTS